MYHSLYQIPYSMKYLFPKWFVIIFIPKNQAITIMNKFICLNSRTYSFL